MLALQFKSFNPAPTIPPPSNTIAEAAGSQTVPPDIAEKWTKTSNYSLVKERPSFLSLSFDILATKLPPNADEWVGVKPADSFELGRQF